METDLAKDPYHSHIPPKPSLSTSVTSGCHSPPLAPGSSTLSLHSPSPVSSPVSNPKVPSAGTQDGTSSDGSSSSYSSPKPKLSRLKSWTRFLFGRRSHRRPMD